MMPQYPASILVISSVTSYCLRMIFQKSSSSGALDVCAKLAIGAAANEAPAKIADEVRNWRLSIL